jgi:hypothetical protein
VLELDFNTPVSAAGALITSNGYGAFTAQITALDGATVLGTFSESGFNADPDADTPSFIGLVGPSADVTAIQFQITAAADGNLNSYSVGTVYLAYGASVPEPATWGLVLVGFGCLGASLRTRCRPASSLPA